MTPDLWIPKNFTDGVDPHQPALTNVLLDSAATISATAGLSLQ